MICVESSVGLRPKQGVTKIATPRPSRENQTNNSQGLRSSILNKGLAVAFFATGLGYGMVLEDLNISKKS